MPSARTVTFNIALVAVMLAAIPVASASADDARHAARHFDLVNATFDDVTALAIAPAGNHAFHDIPLEQPLRGGLTSITVDVPDGGCLRDLRVTFHGGRSLLYPRIDACRYQGLRLLPHDGGLNPATASTLTQVDTTSRNLEH